MIDQAITVLQDNCNFLLKKKNVVAVGIGYKTVGGKPTDELCIICSVITKVDKASLSAEDTVPQTLASPASKKEFVTDVIETGEIFAHVNRKDRHRPAPGGISIGHYEITAGTLGMWANDPEGPVILSNNHVLANSNVASIGDPVLQPGPIDGGTSSDKIAELKKFINISWTGDNLVDAAIASPSEVEDDPSDCFFANFITTILNSFAELMNRGTRLKAVRPIHKAGVQNVIDKDILGIGTVNGIAEATLGMDVRKSGRTTGLTNGTVTQISAVVNVNYGNGNIARFVDQVLTTDMSEGGDSGSVVVDDSNNAVGLLFAGSSTVTVVNRIQHVFDKLNLSL